MTAGLGKFEKADRGRTATVKKTVGQWALICQWATFRGNAVVVAAHTEIGILVLFAPARMPPEYPRNLKLQFCIHNPVTTFEKNMPARRHLFR
ncbi:MAG: hypothetical protein WA435_11290 [Gallionellaceae bacterium]